MSFPPPTPFPVSWEMSAVQIDHCPTCNTELVELRRGPSWQRQIQEEIGKVCPANTRLYQREKDSHFLILLSNRYAIKKTTLYFKDRDRPIDHYLWRYVYWEKFQEKSLTIEGRPLKQSSENDKQRYYQTSFWWVPTDKTLYADPIKFFKRLQALKNLE